MSQLVTVPFQGDTLFAVEEDGAVYVAIKPIADGLGLKWSGQHDRLHRDPILSEGIRVTRMPTPGGPQETTVLRLDLVQGSMNVWLHKQVVQKLADNGGKVPDDLKHA